MTVYFWITENWEKLIPVGVLIALLSLTGNITVALRAAKRGLKEALTPLGFGVLLALAFIAYQIYSSLRDAL